MDTVYFTELTNNRTAQFNRITYINDEHGEKMATVSSEPHQVGMRGTQWIQVQFSNAALGTGRWATIFRMFRNLGCEYTGVSRLDIACDGLEGDGGDFTRVMELERTGHVKYYGKCDWLTRKSRSRVTGGEFGTRASNKFIRAYNKKREMKRKGVKKHLVDMWEQALGFNPMEELVEVHRFEVQLKGKEIRRYFPDERKESFILSLADDKHRVDVFASMAPGMFDFRIPAKYARDAVAVCEWDFSRVRAGDPIIAERAERNTDLNDHTIKVGLTSMAKIGLSVGDPGALEFARNYACAAGKPMLEWYERKLILLTKELAQLASAGNERAIEMFYRLTHPRPGVNDPPDPWAHLPTFAQPDSNMIV